MLRLRSAVSAHPDRLMLTGWCREPFPDHRRTAAARAIGGCNFVVLAPAGDVAAQQRDLIVASTVLMLLIIMPVMALTVFFAWRYRQSNKEGALRALTGTTRPGWKWSSGPRRWLIIICLGAMTWVGTHLLDPYRPLGRIAAGRPCRRHAAAEVEVVALDWKWLFIYPEQGIATVNELAAPVDRPISFRITASGDELLLHPRAGRPDLCHAGHADEAARGDQPCRRVSGPLGQLQRRRLLRHALQVPRPDRPASTGGSRGGEVRRQHARPARISGAGAAERERPGAPLCATVDPDLFNAILNRCVEPGKMCMPTR
jgi:cytochrome o ubiquinol oxidase subunit 2